MSDVVLLQPCVPWHRYVREDGYGLAWDPKRKAMRMAHRVLWEIANGVMLPDDIELDHLCRRRDCVELTHLALVDRDENNRRGRSWTWRTEITHCPDGHPYTPENTGQTVLRRGTEHESRGRYCRACKTEKSRVRRARLRV